jgi:hypothetical protein
MTYDPPDLAYFAFIAFMLAVGLVAVLRYLAKEKKLKQEAAARGWTIERRLEQGNHVHSWAGTTDGVSWTADSGPRGRGSKLSISRWHADWPTGLAGPVLCVGVNNGEALPEGDDLISRLRRHNLATGFGASLDSCFGAGVCQEIDGDALKRIDRGEVPGVVVAALDPDEGGRVLSGMRQALSTLPFDDMRILLRPNGISLARYEEFRDASNVEVFIRTGLALKNAFMFVRRSSF